LLTESKLLSEVTDEDCGAPSQMKGRQTKRKRSVGHRRTEMGVEFIE
jgi:hypothetical protein